MTNLVEEYLLENKGQMLSVRSLSKRLDIRKKYVFYLAHQSNKLRKVNSSEVGSGSNRLHVFTAI